MVSRKNHNESFENLDSTSALFSTLKRKCKTHRGHANTAQKKSNVCFHHSNTLFLFFLCKMDKFNQVNERSQNSIKKKQIHVPTLKCTIARCRTVEPHYGILRKYVQRGCLPRFNYSFVCVFKKYIKCTQPTTPSHQFASALGSRNARDSSIYYENGGGAEDNSPGRQRRRRSSPPVPPVLSSRGFST